MMKDVRKAFGTFWRTQSLQGVIFEDFHEKHRFSGPLEAILRQLRVCEPLRFLLFCLLRFVWFHFHDIYLSLAVVLQEL